MPINHEYLVEMPIDATPEQRDRVYKIIMTYAFPMNTNPFNKSFIDKLSEEDRQLLYTSEFEFLSNKLKKEISERISLVPMPKTLYQFCSVKYLYFKAAIRLPSFPFGTEYTDDETLYQSIITFIHKNQAAWWDINNALIRDWRVGLADIDSFIEDQMRDFTELCPKKLRDIPKEYMIANESGRKLAPYTNKKYTDLAVGFLKRAVLEEQYQHDHYLLYCAVSGRVKASTLTIDPKLSWSFGDGLATGFLYDFGACCLKYLLESYDPRELAIFPVHKLNYIQAESLERNLVFIPPIPSMFRLMGEHEFHHARTKVSSLAEHFIFGYGGGYDDAVRQKIKLQPVFIANNMQPEMYKQALGKLCRNYQFGVSVAINVRKSESYFNLHYLQARDIAQELFPSRVAALIFEYANLLVEESEEGRALPVATPAKNQVSLIAGASEEVVRPAGVASPLIPVSSPAPPLLQFSSSMLSSTASNAGKKLGKRKKAKKR